MSLSTQIGNLAVRVGTEFKTVRVEIGDVEALIGTLASLTTTDKTSLVAAINEVAAGMGTGGATTLDGLTDVVITSAATGDILRFNGTSWVDAVGTDYFDAAGSAASAQAASQPLDSDLTAIAALTTTTYGRALLTLANQAGLMALLSAASDTASGIVELATTTEAIAGTDTVRAVTPAGVAAAIAAIVDSAPATMDTLNELAAALGDDPNFATSMSTALGNRVRTDTNAQGLDSTQKQNARTNIDVYSTAEIGSVTSDFVATFEAALV